MLARHYENICGCQLQQLFHDRREAGHVAFAAHRDRRHAELAAAVDAMMQAPALRPAVEGAVVAKLARAQAERRDTAARKAAATIAGSTRLDRSTRARRNGTPVAPALVSKVATIEVRPVLMRSASASAFALKSTVSSAALNALHGLPPTVTLLSLPAKANGARMRSRMPPASSRA